MDSKNIFVMKFQVNIQGKGVGSRGLNLRTSITANNCQGFKISHGYARLL